MRNPDGNSLCLAMFLGSVGQAIASDKPATPTTPAAPTTPATTETLLIGPGDVLHIQVLDTPELEQHPRVTDAGVIPLIGVGSAKVAGLTPQEAAAEVRQLLISSHYMNHPDVTVTIESYTSQTVSVLGQVKTRAPIP